VAVLASTVITDIASLVLLAICIQFKRHAIPPGRIAGSISIFDHIGPDVLGKWFPILFLAVIASFSALSLWLLPKAMRRVLSRFHHVLRDHPQLLSIKTCKFKLTVNFSFSTWVI
jgi:Kef-type K+ transport system membrane component KefB